MGEKKPASLRVGVPEVTVFWLTLEHITEDLKSFSFCCSLVKSMKPERRYYMQEINVSLILPEKNNITYYGGSEVVRRNKMFLDMH